jgi:lysophospholipid acyltransferase (LPLAT)-like uncharacterized protein
MKLRAPWVIRVVGLLGAWLVRLWMGTVRCRFHSADSRAHPTDPRSEPYLYAFWHETILFGVAFKARACVLTSQSADGELMTRMCGHLGLQVVRGSSTRGGSDALLTLLGRGGGRHLAVTPDGPRGPRRRVKLGLIFLASRTGLPIVPFGVGFSRAWRARSWDHFAVPWPWSTAHCVLAPAIRVPVNLNRSGLEHYRQLVEDQLAEATAAAERWAQGKPAPPTIDAAGRPGQSGRAA